MKHTSTFKRSPFYSHDAKGSLHRLFLITDGEKFTFNNARVFSGPSEDES